MVVGELADAVDLLVLGGGPGGYTAAIRAAQLGRQVTLVERGGVDGLGGVCLQAGCVPAKALIELARTASRAEVFERMGLSMTGLEVSLPRFQAWRAELCGGLARGVARRLQTLGVSIVHGSARFNRSDRVAVHTPQDRVTFLEFEQAIIATGSRASEPAGVRRDGVRVLDSTDALALSSLPASAAVIGAGYIGLELATALAKLGTRVTLVEARDRILPRLDDRLTQPVARRLSALGVGVRTDTVAVGLKDGGLVVRGAAGEQRIEAERVILAAGRTPNTDELGLGAAAIPVGSDGRIEVAPDMRANERVAAVGDVVNGPPLAHKASAQAVVAAEALCGLPTAFEPSVVAQVIFCDPELATAGLDEQGARRAGIDVRVGTFPLAASGRAGILGAPEGFARLVAEAHTDRLIGVHLVGAQASELAGEGALAIEMMATATDLAATLHPHPTISESLREAADILVGNPINVAAAAKLVASSDSPPHRERGRLDDPVY